MIFKINSTQIGNFQLKEPTWINNYQIPPHPNATLLTPLEIKLIPKVKFFSWKLIRDRIPRRENLENLASESIVTLLFVQTI